MVLIRIKRDNDCVIILFCFIERIQSFLNIPKKNVLLVGSHPQNYSGFNLSASITPGAIGLGRLPEYGTEGIRGGEGYVAALPKLFCCALFEA